MASTEAVLHGAAASDYAHAYLRVTEARERLLALAREDKTFHSRGRVSGDRFIEAVQDYQAASANFCQQQENLHEAAIHDPRAECIFCRRRVEDKDWGADCPALRRAYPGEPERMIRHKFKEKK